MHVFTFSFFFFVCVRVCGVGGGGGAWPFLEGGQLLCEFLCASLGGENNPK